MQKSLQPAKQQLSEKWKKIRKGIWVVECLKLAHLTKT